MQVTVLGDANQCAVAQMAEGDEIRAEVGAMVLLSDGIALEAPAGHGVAAADLPPVKSPVPLTHFRCMGSLGVAAFAAPCSGEIRQLDIRSSAWLCARDSFLFCSRDVSTAVGFVHGVDSGYFHEGGYVLYRLGGHGDAYIHCGGNVIEYELSPGQRVSVDAGCVAAFQDSVQPAIEAFDGLPSGLGPSESLFLVTLTGPGRIYLSTLPLSRIAQATKGGRRLPARSSGPNPMGRIVNEL